MGIADVAREARVSPAVVSRVFHGDATLRLKPETRALVLRMIEVLGYTPDSAAQGLRKSRTRTIGLILDQVTSPMLTELVAAAQRAALAAGYVVILVDAGEVEEGLARVNAMIAANRIDGLLLQVGFGPGAEKVLGLAAAVPSVLFNDPGTDSLSSVQLDDEGAVALAVGHLVALGHRRLAFVSVRASSTSDRRRDAFLRAARAAPHKVHAAVAAGTGWTPEQSHRAVLRLLARTGTRPTGLVAVNTVAALGVMSGVAAAGLSVPGDVSIVAIHDTWFAPHLNPPLTTVRLPLEALGRTIVELLVARLNGGEVAHVKVSSPPPELLRRDSTGAPPATVARAPRTGSGQAATRRGR